MKETQQKYMELQLLDQQMKQLQQHLMETDAKTQQLEQIIKDLQDIQQVKEGTDILVPLAGGIFVKGNIGATDKLLVNVGSNVNVEKDVPAIVDIIKHQIKQMHDVQQTLQSQFTAFSEQFAKLQQDISKDV